MSRARVLSFGSIPPEWGGVRRGGVATFHRVLVETIQSDLDSPVQIAAIVSTGSGKGSAPAPVRILADGQDRTEFLRAILDEFDPDVAILNHVATSWGRLLPRIAPQLPLLGIAHSWNPVTRQEEPASAINSAQRAIDGLAAIVFPSAHCLQEGLALGLRYPDVAYVIRNPLSDLFAGPIALDRPRSGVVFAGRLMEPKHPAVLLDAAALVPDVMLMLAGDGEDRARLESQARKLGVAERVRFPGSIDQDVLRLAMASAETVCVPSDNESFGIAYIEALSCGTPVVGASSAVAEIARTSGINVGIGLRRASREAVAAAIEQVRSMQWDRSVLRRAVLEAYDSREVAADYTKAILACL